MPRTCKANPSQFLGFGDASVGLLEDALGVGVEAVDVAGRVALLAYGLHVGFVALLVGAGGGDRSGVTTAQVLVVLLLVAARAVLGCDALGELETPMVPGRLAVGRTLTLVDMTEAGIHRRLREVADIAI